MDFLKNASEGIAKVEAPETSKKEAVRNLGKWLNEPEFAEYHPQIKWLVEKGDFAGLVDRF